MFTAIKKWLHRMFGKTEEKTVQPVKTKKKLSRADKKQIEAAIVRANGITRTGPCPGFHGAAVPAAPMDTAVCGSKERRSAANQSVKRRE